MFEVHVLVKNNPVPCRSSFTDCSKISMYYVLCAVFTLPSTFTSLLRPAAGGAFSQHAAETTMLHAGDFVFLTMCCVWLLYDLSEIPTLVSGLEILRGPLCPEEPRPELHCFQAALSLTGSGRLS